MVAQDRREGSTAVNKGIYFVVARALLALASANMCHITMMLHYSCMLLVLTDSSTCFSIFDVFFWPQRLPATGSRATT